MHVSASHFKRLLEEVVSGVMASLPCDLRELASGVLITAADRPDILQLEKGEAPDDLLGLYEGTSLPERHGDDTLSLPDRITLFRIPIMEMCNNEKELRREIHLTVIHELGHFFGFSEDDLDERGLG